MAIDRPPKLCVRRGGGPPNTVGDDGGAVESMEKATDDGGSTSMAEKKSKEEARRKFEEEIDTIMFEGDRVRVSLDRYFIDIVLSDTDGFIHLVRRDIGQTLYRFPSILEFRSFLSGTDSSIIAERAYLSENVTSETVKVAQLSGGVIGSDGSDLGGGSFSGGVDDAGGIGDGGYLAGVGGTGGGAGDDDDSSSGGGPSVGGSGGGFIEIKEVREKEKGDCKDEVGGLSSKEVKRREETEKIVDDNEVGHQSVSEVVDSHKPIKDKPKCVKEASAEPEDTPILRKITGQTRETKGISALIHIWKSKLRKANGRLQSNYASLLKDHTNMEKLLKTMQEKCNSIEQDQEAVQLLEEELDKVTATLSSFRDGIIVASKHQYMDLQKELSKDSLILCKFDNSKKYEIKKLVEDDGRRCIFYDC